ncbi:MAG: sigma-70 family RNA polymerase sigma factor [Candidatus Limnocylindria bacterium]
MSPKPSRARSASAALAVDPDFDDVRAAQADRTAFAVLYRRYLDPVYGYSFYLLGDHHDAEDATERTFLAAMDALDRFRDTGSSFRSWLFRIAHNQLANALRSRHRHPAEPLDTIAEPRGSNDPARLAGQAEDARRLRGAVARLSGDRRHVVILRFVDGLTTREIANVLGRSDGAVRVLQHRALADLAELLDEGTPAD